MVLYDNFIFRLKFWSPLIMKRIKRNSWNMQMHKSIIKNLNVASKMKASKTKPLVQFELLLLVYMHCNIVLQSHTYLLWKMSFYKILLFNAFDDHTRQLKSSQYRVYPCISVLELDVLQTLPVWLWTVHFFVTPCTQCLLLQQKNISFCNSLELFPRPQWGKEGSITLLIDKRVLERLGSKVSAKWVPNRNVKDLLT